MRSSNNPDSAPKQRYLNPLMHQAIKRSAYWQHLSADHKYFTRIKNYIAKHKDEPEFLNAHLSKTKSDTILTWACQNGYVEHLEQLLNCKGVDINGTNRHGEPALLIASGGRHVNIKKGDAYEKMIDLLFAYPGININQRSHDSRETVLTKSLRGQMKDISVKILRHGGHDNESLQAAFKIAVRESHTDFVSAILEYPEINVNVGLEVESKSEENKYTYVNVLYYAVTNNCVEIVRAILNHPSSKNKADQEFIKKCVLLAASNNNIKMLIVFIEKNLDTNVELFTWAADQRHETITNALMAKPAFNGNNLLLDGHNHLTWAIAHDQINLAEQLLNHPTVIDVNAHTLNGNTALILAAELDLDICNLLLARPGIEVNAKNNAGDTALIKAAACGFTLTLQSLIKHPGIDVNLANNNGETALIAACKSGDQECIESLLARPELKINMLDNGGRSALIIAVMKGKAENVKSLLMRSDINLAIQDNNGKTALMYAAELGRTNVVRMLLTHDASDVNVQDNNGDTALIHAARSHDNAIIIESLFEYGANPNIKNKAAYTALMEAKKNAHKGICPLLKNPPVHAEYQVAPPYASVVYQAPSAPPIEDPAPTAPAFEAGNPSSPRLGLFAQQTARESSSKITTDTKAALRKSI